MQKRILVRLVMAVGCLVPVAIMLAYNSFRVSAQGTRIAYGETVEGDVAGTGERDTWRFEGNSGDIISVRVQQTGGNLQPSVALTDPDGVLLVALDQAEQDASVAAFTTSLRVSGEHILAVEGNVNTTGTYTLTLELRQSSQSAGNEGGIITYGRVTNGTISDEVFRQFWSFRGTQGDVIDAVMTVTSGDLDAYLSLSAPDGTALASTDVLASDQSVGLYAVKLPASGTYSLTARRSGANSGASGTTQGAYTLNLVLRSPGLADGEATPAALALETEVRGRLTADAPSALYSIDSIGTGSILSVALDLVDPLRVGTLSIMTSDRALLGVFSGTAPLRIATSAAGQNRVLVEVTMTGIRENTPVDYALRVDVLDTDRRSSEPLLYAHPREVTSAVNTPESWHFAGKTGEMVTVYLESFSPVLNGLLQIFAPDNTLLVSRSIEPILEQPLALAADGLYEVVVDPTTAAGGYRITVTRDGIAGLAFEQLAFAEIQGTLRPGGNNAVAANLRPGSSHAWTLDVQQAQMWAFQLNQTGANAPLALVIEGPDGAWLEISVSDRLSNTAFIQLLLPHAGRYRAVVFDPTGTTANAYTLSGESVEGGNLPVNVSMKGVLTPARGRDTWTLTAASGSFLNLKVRDLEGNSGPVVNVIGPDGQRVLSPWRENGEDLFGIPLAEGGTYKIIVGQPDVSRRIVYSIVAEVMAVFQAQTGTTFVSDLAAAEVFAPDKTPSRLFKQVNIVDQITLPVRPDPAALLEATPLETGSLIRGVVASGTLYQLWALNVSAGQMLGISAVAMEEDGDPDLVLLDQQGRTLAQYFQADSTTAYMTYRTLSAGPFYLAVRLEKGGHYLVWVDVLMDLDERVPDVIPGPLVTYGQTVSGTLALPDGSRQYVFYGNVNDVLMAHVVATQGNWQPRLAVLDAAGTALNQASSETIDNVRLPDTDLYRIEVTAADSSGTQAGAFSLHLNLRQTPGGTNHGGGMLRDQHYGRLSGDPAQRWLFEGESGETVTVRVEPLAPGSLAPLKIQMTDSAGHVFLNKEARFGQGALVFGEVLLPRSGIYQVIVSGGQRTSGQYRISLERDARLEENGNSVISYGETRGQVLTRENYLDVWTFAGSQGDTISILARTIRGDPAALSWQLRTQNAEVLATVTDGETGTGARAEALVLPEDGPYSIIVGNPDGTFEGEAVYVLTVLLEGTQARSMGERVTYNRTVEGTFWADDLTDTWLFEGSQGDRITAIVRGENPDLKPSISLVSTDWHMASQAGQAEIVSSAQVVEGSPAQIQAVLPASGPYALVVQDPTHSGGRYQLEILGPSSLRISGTTVTPGLSQNGQIGAEKQSETWTFSGETQANVIITVTPDSRSLLAPAITLIGPDGSPVAKAEAQFRQIVQLGDYQLPETGTYTILVTAADENAGGRYILDLQQTLSSPPITSQTAYDRLERGVLDAESFVHQWSFAGQAGDVVHIVMEATSGDLDPAFRLYDPNGAFVAAGDDNKGLDSEARVTLPADGAYILEVVRYGEAQGVTSGNYALTIENVYQPGPVTTEHLLVYGERVTGTTTSQEPSAFWTFSGEQGDTLRAKIQFAQDDAPLLLFLRDPEGTLLASGVRDRGDSIIEAFTLPAQGQYTFEVRRPGDARASFSPYTLDLELLDMDGGAILRGGILVPGQTVTGRIDRAADTHLWIFEGSADQTFALSIAALQGPFDIQVSLRAPDGTFVFSTQTLASVTRVFSSGLLTMPLDGLYTLLITGQEPGLIYRLAFQPAMGDAASGHDLQPLQDVFSRLDDATPQEMWTFEAAAGKVLALRIQTISGDLEPTLLLWGPDGLPLVEGIQDGGQASITAFVAPQSGTFTVTAGRVGGVSGSTSGNYRLLLRTYVVTAQAAEAVDVAFGETVTGYASRSYAFQGLTGSLVGVSVRVLDGGSSPKLSLETEAGEHVEVPTVVSETEVTIPVFMLPGDARYVLTLDTDEASRYELTVFRREHDTAQAGIVRDLSPGREAAEGLDIPMQPVHWNLTGEAGNVLIFTANTTGGGLRADMVLYGPHGYIATAAEQPGSRITTLGPVRLPDNGAYVLVVGAWLNRSSGPFTIRAEEAEPGISGSVGGPLPALGQTVTGGLITEDDQDIWTFEGRAGSVMAVRAEQTYGNGSLALDLVGADDTILASGQASTAYLGVEIEGVILPNDGTYRVVIRGQLADTNAHIEYRLAIIHKQDPVVGSMASAQGIAYGQIVTSVLNPETLYHAWVFWGQVGDRIQVILQPADGKLLYLVGPGGRTLFAGSVPPAGVSGQVLRESGFYGLVVEVASGSSSEAFTLQLERLPTSTAPQGTLEDTSGGQLTASTPVHEWVLSSQFGGDYVVWLEWRAPGSLPDLFIVDGERQTVAYGIPESRRAARAAVRLGADQLYAAVVSGGPSIVQGQYVIQLIPAALFTDGGAIGPDETNVGRINGDHLSDEWHFTAEAGQQIVIEIRRTSGDLVARGLVFDIGGKVIAEQNGDDDGVLVLSFEVPETGRYSSLVSRADEAAGRTAGDYTITLLLANE